MKVKLLCAVFLLTTISCERPTGVQPSDVPVFRCEPDDHIARIMAGQVDVATCSMAGTGSSTNQGQIDEFKRCILEAFAARRPFRAWPTFRSTVSSDNPPRHIIDHTNVLGRVTADGFECIEIRARGFAEESTLDIGAVTLTRDPPTFTVIQGTQDGGLAYSWVRPSCAPDPIPRPSPSPTAYDPPRVLPLGQVCPRD